MAPDALTGRMATDLKPGTEPSKPYGRLSTIVRFVLGTMVLIFTSTPTFIVSLFLLPWRSLRVRVGNVFGKIVGYSAVRLAGAVPEVEHKERLEAYAPAIYLCNHASMLDVVTGIWLCPYGGVGVGKREVIRVPFFGWIFALTGHLLLDRKNRADAIAGLASLGGLVRKHRMSVWIYPEGTRAYDGRLLPFKKGFVHLAIASGLPVVPVVLHNTYLRWPNRTFKLHPGPFPITVLPKIDTSSWSAERVEEHLAEVRQAYLAALGQNQQPIEPLGSPLTVP